MLKIFKLFPAGPISLSQVTRRNSTSRLGGRWSVDWDPIFPIISCRPGINDSTCGVNRDPTVSPRLALGSSGIIRFLIEETLELATYATDDEKNCLVVVARVAVIFFISSLGTHLWLDKKRLRSFGFRYNKMSRDKKSGCVAESDGWDASINPTSSLTIWLCNVRPREKDRAELCMSTFSGYKEAAWECLCKCLDSRWGYGSALSVMWSKVCNLCATVTEFRLLLLPLHQSWPFESCLRNENSLSGRGRNEVTHARSHQSCPFGSCSRNENFLSGRERNEGASKNLQFQMHEMAFRFDFFNTD